MVSIAYCHLKLFVLYNLTSFRSSGILLKITTSFRTGDLQLYRLTSFCAVIQDLDYGAHDLCFSQSGVENLRNMVRGGDAVLAVSSSLVSLRIVA